jgi:hypothetical protein
MILDWFDLERGKLLWSLFKSVGWFHNIISSLVSQSPWIQEKYSTLWKAGKISQNIFLLFLNSVATVTLAWSWNTEFAAYKKQII